MSLDDTQQFQTRRERREAERQAERPVFSAMKGLGEAIRELRGAIGVQARNDVQKIGDSIRHEVSEIKEDFKFAGQEIKSGTQLAGDKLAGVADKAYFGAKDSIERFNERTDRFVTRVEELDAKIEQKVQGAAQTLVDESKNFVRDTKALGTEIKERTQEITGKVDKGLNDAFDRFDAKAEQFADNVEKLGQDIKNNVQGAGKALAGKAREFGAGAQEFGRETKGFLSRIGGKIRDAAQTVGTKASEFGNKVKEGVAHEISELKADGQFVKEELTKVGHDLRDDAKAAGAKISAGVRTGVDKAVVQPSQAVGDTARGLGSMLAAARAEGAKLRESGSVSVQAAGKPVQAPAASPNAAQKTQQTAR